MILRTRAAALVLVLAGAAVAGILSAGGMTSTGSARPLAVATSTAALFGSSPRAHPAVTATSAAPHGVPTRNSGSLLPQQFTPSPTATPAPLVAPTSARVELVTPVPAATPRVTTFGTLDHSILYDTGSQLALISAQGKSRSGLSFLSANSGKRPRFSGGWQYVYFNNGFWLGDIYGHQQPIVPPSIPGEEVFDAIPSPNGEYIAWQMVTPATIAGNIVNTGASRIVISDSTGGNARTLLQQAAGTSYGDIPLIYGWRPGSPPTLLVQTNYAIPSMLGLHRGLEEFDPTVLDLVNDYLPPLGEDTLPQGEVVGVSASGSIIAYSSTAAHLPSGEGPFPTNLEVMAAQQRRTVLIDTASGRKDRASGKLPAPRAYIFARQAYISPDDSRIAYTRLDILYPKGALHPYVRPIACLANLDGSGKVDFGQDERVMGWAGPQTVIVRRENTHTNGLYAVDLNTGRTTRILLGNALAVDGIVP